MTGDPATPDDEGALLVPAVTGTAMPDPASCRHRP